MRKYIAYLAAAAFVSCVVVGAVRGGVKKEKDDPLGGWTHDFGAEKPDLVSSGSNPYFVLEPGYVLVLKNGDEQLTVTIKKETKLVDGVMCGILEEKETKRGKLDELSNNYFAISTRTNSVYYFGEDAGGAWFSGENGATFGLMMPGLPLVGAKYYQELAPHVAMDRAEIVSVSETVKTPAGEFKNCLKVEETTPLEPGNKEYKYYAPGIGLIQDGSLKLVEHGRTEK